MESHVLEVKEGEASAGGGGITTVKPHRAAEKVLIKSIILVKQKIYYIYIYIHTHTHTHSFLETE